MHCPLCKSTDPLKRLRENGVCPQANRAVALVGTPELSEAELAQIDAEGYENGYTEPAVETRLTAEKPIRSFAEWVEPASRFLEAKGIKNPILLEYGKTIHQMPKGTDALTFFMQFAEAFRDKSEAPLLERIEQLMDAVSELNSFDVPKALVDERMANAGLREEIERLGKSSGKLVSLLNILAIQANSKFAEKSIWSWDDAASVIERELTELRAKLAEQERTIKELRSAK